MKSSVLGLFVAGGLVLPMHAQAQACTRSARIEQFNLTDVRAVLARALSITTYGSERTSAVFKNSVRSTDVCLDSLPFLARWTRGAPAVVEMAPARVDVIGNSAYPRSMNDGVLWAGKGLNSVLTVGGQARWRFLSAAVLPVFAYQQNDQHNYVRAGWEGRSPFSHPDYGGIDLPKRFGEDAFSTRDLGQSFIRADYGPASVAFSNENLWLGTMQVYPLLISNSAPGFPHVRVGTSRALDLRVINAELNIFWGSVAESDYFDGRPDNDSHFFTATSVMIEPRFLKGLHVGYARVFHDTLKATGQNIGFYTDRIIESPLFIEGGNRPGNGIGALYLRWVHTASGFEVYGEWSRDDTPYNLEDILREPDWTSAYAAGAQKVFVSPARLTRVYGELIRLGASTATVRSGRSPFTTYTHYTAVHGHTHRGQILGSGTGLGSDAQRVGVDVFTANGMTGGYIERIRYDDDTYYARFARRFGEARHDVEITAGLQRVQFIGPIEVRAGASFSRRYDRDFISLREEADVMIETNIGTTLTFQWRP